MKKGIIHEGDFYSLILSCIISLLGLESLDSLSGSEQDVNLDVCRISTDR